MQIKQRVGDLSVECHQIGSAHRVRIDRSLAGYRELFRQSVSACSFAVSVLTALLERGVSRRRPVIRSLYAGLSARALAGREGRQQPRHDGACEDF
jgi:hypothetical protein